jgi:hypothetical protein
MTGHTVVREAATIERMSVGMQQRVEIHIRGPVPMDEADRLGLQASTLPADTVLRGTVADRPALHGVLDTLFVHGLELVSVRRLPGDR